MGDDRGFQPILRPDDEDGLLEALAARKGIGRLQGPARPLPAGPDAAAPDAPAARGPETDAAAATEPGPRAKPRAAAARPAGQGIRTQPPPADPAPAPPADPARAEAASAGPAPTPRSRMRAMNLELPDYAMQQLKERALREDCSVRHVIMTALASSGIRIEPADLVPDGRRSRGGRRPG